MPFRLEYEKLMTLQYEIRDGEIPIRIVSAASLEPRDLSIIDNCPCYGSVRKETFDCI